MSLEPPTDKPSRPLSWWARFLVEEVRDLLHPLVTLPRRLNRWLFFRPEKRILGILHLYEHQGAYGDTIIFMQNLNVLRHRHGARRIDLCYIDDRTSPHFAPHPYYDDPERKRVLLSLHRLLPGLDGVMRFDSEADFERFFQVNHHRYIPFPPYGRFHSWPSRINYWNIRKRKKTRHKNISPIKEYHAAHGAIPHLSAAPEDLEWARAFLSRHVSPARPIVVQLRKSRIISDRDTDLTVWGEFLKHYEGQTKFRFVVIGDAHELVPEFRALPHVVFSKDSGSDLFKDLALIQSSFASVLPNSGPAAFAWFTGTPFLNFGLVPNYHPEDVAVIDIQDYEQLKFLNATQKLFWGPYTAQDMIREFDALAKALETRPGGPS